MLARIARRGILSVLVPALALGGCDGVREPTALVPTSPVLNVATGAPITLVKQGVARAFSGSASTVIGSGGGILRVGHHLLIVPANAVEAATAFAMKVNEDGYIDVELSATRRVNGMRVRVGTAADPFLRPVQLRLSYRSATGIGAEHKLLVTYLPQGSAGGPLQGRSTWIDTTNKVVWSHLDHFSHYAIGEQ